MLEIDNYNNLCEQIEIWKTGLKALQEQQDALYKLGKLDGPNHIQGIDYTKPVVQTTKQMGFLDVLNKIYDIGEQMDKYKNMIDNLEKAKEDIEQRLRALEGIDREVVYLRDIKGLRLEDIAEYLGYSESHIKRVSARNKRNGKVG